MPPSERNDFYLYVDEFQNFATDSFENILSEARKYRLNLILANQFVSQLTDKIREAIIGNVGTVISGRIGTTDAELMAKKFMPVFDAEDLTKLPNYESVVVAQINGVPSSPFSMSFIPPLGRANPQLAAALKRLSAAKFGKPRQDVEKAIFTRLRAGDTAREAKKKTMLDSQRQPGDSTASKGSSFLDEWLAKRKQLQQDPKPVVPPPSAPVTPKPVTDSPAPQPAQAAHAQVRDEPTAKPQPMTLPIPDATDTHVVEPYKPAPIDDESVLQINLPKLPSDDGQQGKLSEDEIYIDLRGNLHHGKPGETAAPSQDNK